jgi:hypothetical protein
MKRKRPWLKAASLLATGSLVFQFGGCSLGSFARHAQIGFAQEMGGILAWTAWVIAGYRVCPNGQPPPCFDPEVGPRLWWGPDSWPDGSPGGPP